MTNEYDKFILVYKEVEKIIDKASMFVPIY